MDISAFSAGGGGEEPPDQPPMDSTDEGLSVKILTLTTAVKYLAWLALAIPVLFYSAILSLFMLSWLCALWLQTRLFLFTSAVLRSCMAEPQPVANAVRDEHRDEKSKGLSIDDKVREDHVLEDATVEHDHGPEPAREDSSKSNEVREAAEPVATAEGYDQDPTQDLYSYSLTGQQTSKKSQELDELPTQRHLEEPRKPIGFSAEQLAEARSFASEATRGKGPRSRVTKHLQKSKTPSFQSIVSNKPTVRAAATAESRRARPSMLHAPPITFGAPVNKLNPGTTAPHKRMLEEARAKRHSKQSTSPVDQTSVVSTPVADVQSVLSYEEPFSEKHTHSTAGSNTFAKRLNDVSNWPDLTSLPAGNASGTAEKSAVIGNETSVTEKTAGPLRPPPGLQNVQRTSQALFDAQLDEEELYDATPPKKKSQHRSKSPSETLNSPRATTGANPARQVTAFDSVAHEDASKGLNDAQEMPASTTSFLMPLQISPPPKLARDSLEASSFHNPRVGLCDISNDNGTTVPEECRTSNQDNIEKVSQRFVVPSPPLPDHHPGNMQERSGAQDGGQVPIREVADVQPLSADTAAAREDELRSNIETENKKPAKQDSSPAAFSKLGEFPTLSVDQGPAPKTSAPGDAAGATTKNELTQQMKAALHALKESWCDREQARVKVYGNWSFESAQTLQNVTIDYNKKRDALKELRPDGKLSENDEKMFPRFANIELGVPKHKPTGAVEILKARKDANRNDSARENSDNDDEAQTAPADPSTAFEEAKKSAISARNLLQNALNSHARPSKASQASGRATHNARIERATRNYINKRKALEEIIPSGWTTELLQELPEVDSIVSSANVW